MKDKMGIGLLPQIYLFRDCKYAMEISLFLFKKYLKQLLYKNNIFKYLDTFMFVTWNILCTSYLTEEYDIVCWKW